MSYTHEIQDSILIFTIDYDPSNSITTETLHGLEKAVDRVNQEEELKGLVIIGQGRFFSSGFDLATFISFASPDDIIKWFSYEEEVMYKLLTCSKPVVAAINGHATAAGMIIAQACDYRLIKNDAKIKVGMTEIKLGMALTPCQGEIMRFGLDTNKNWREIMYKGLLITPQKAVEMGILDELVEGGELIAKAKAKIVEYIDTPNRSFVHLKAIERKHVARQAREGIDTNTYQRNIDTFNDPNVKASIKMTLEKMAQSNISRGRFS
jgi:enoyl-CoA hydratase/carnithine racemase